jgi:hypothetical protein
MLRPTSAKWKTNSPARSDSHNPDACACHTTQVWDQVDRDTRQTTRTANQIRTPIGTLLSRASRLRRRTTSGARRKDRARMPATIQSCDVHAGSQDVDCFPEGVVDDHVPSERVCPPEAEEQIEADPGQDGHSQQPIDEGDATLSFQDGIA